MLKGVIFLKFRSLILCLLFLWLSFTSVFAESTITQGTDVGHIDLYPTNMLNKTETQWHRCYWDGTNMYDVEYRAVLTPTVDMLPNVEANNTELNADGNLIVKSGYGFTLDVNGVLVSSAATAGMPGVNADTTTSSVQSMNVYFPEFGYADGIDGGYGFQVYNRLGDLNSLTESGASNVSSSLITLRTNGFSGNDGRVHFLPFWLPDGYQYTPYIEIFDAWTPGGMLGTTLTSTIEIDSQVYDDWHIAPTVAPD